MEKEYRTVKSSKFTGTVSRKAVATAVRTLSEGKSATSRVRDSAASRLSPGGAKGSAHVGSRLKKR